MVKETITLYCQNDKSDKYYTISIIEENGGFNVTFNHGRRGTSGQSGCKTKEPVPYEKAKKIYDRVVKEKIEKKHYHEDQAMSPAAVTVTEKVDSGFLPQLLNPIEEDEVEKYLKDDNYGAQEKKDGKRKFLKHGENNTVSINRKGQEVGFAIVFEEACQAMAKKGRDKFVLDGEEIGETLHVFDTVCIDGEVLYDMPYLWRYNKLKEFMEDNDHPSLQLVPLAIGYEEKKALYEKLKAEDKEGIVFKRLDAPYVPDRPDKYGDQVKFKFYDTASLIVIRINEKRSIGLGILDNGQVIDVGNCTIPPNKDIPAVDEVVEIKYLYAYKGGSLYQPIYLEPRDDIDREECIIGQLKYKAEEE